MKFSLLVITTIIGASLTSCKDGRPQDITSEVIIGNGQMPNATNDITGNFHIVFGSGDSIMYAASTDHGKSFSAPALVSVLPGLAASHMRGPQIAATSNGLTIIACNKEGDIFSYNMTDSGNWIKSARVNDTDTVAKEQLMALSGDKGNLYAVWLDLRDKHNKIVGAGSNDGGKTWSKNVMIYASPDTTVCECCKPSVVIEGNNVHVMFRNWLNGNRDLYLIQSSDRGLTFSNAQKLGTGSWALNGCPMDGGGLVVQDSKVQTVWNRRGKIYTCEPGKPEQQIGEGRNCTLEIADGKNVYAWIEKGAVICLLPPGEKKILGKGTTPVLKAIGNEQILCVWENENQIHSTILSL